MTLLPSDMAALVWEPDGHPEMGEFRLDVQDGGIAGSPGEVDALLTRLAPTEGWIAQTHRNDVWDLGHPGRIDAHAGVPLDGEWLLPDGRSLHMRHTGISAWRWQVLVRREDGGVGERVLVHTHHPDAPPYALYEVSWEPTSPLDDGWTCLRPSLARFCGFRSTKEPT